MARNMLDLMIDDFVDEFWFELVMRLWLEIGCVVMMVMVLWCYVVV